MGKGSGPTRSTLAKQRAPQESYKATPSTVIQSAGTGGGSGTSFSNRLEVELALRAAVALCRGTVLAMCCSFPLFLYSSSFLPMCFPLHP